MNGQLRQQIRQMKFARKVFESRIDRKGEQRTREVVEYIDMSDELIEQLIALLAAQQTALLEDIRKNGTYLRKDSGFAPGLWLKVDIIDEALSKLRKELKP